MCVSLFGFTYPSTHSFTQPVRVAQCRITDLVKPPSATHRTRVPVCRPHRQASPSVCGRHGWPSRPGQLAVW